MLWVKILTVFKKYWPILAILAALVAAKLAYDARVEKAFQDGYVKAADEISEANAKLMAEAQKDTLNAQKSAQSESDRLLGLLEVMASRSSVNTREIIREARLIDPQCAISDGLRGAYNDQRAAASRAGEDPRTAQVYVEDSEAEAVIQ